MPGEPSTRVDVAAVIDRVGLSRLQWITISLCGLVAILDGFDTQAIAFVAPVIARDLGVEMSAFGPVFGAGLLGLTVGALAFGPAADRFGRKPVIMACVFVFGMFALLTPLSHSLTTLMLYRFLTGLGLGGAMPNIIALTSEYSPKQKRATLVTLMFCGFPLGAAVGGFVSARLIAAYGWPVVFYLGGILPLLLLPLLWAALPESIRFLVARKSRPEAPLAIMRGIDPTGHYGADSRCVLDEERAEGSSIRELFTGGRAVGTVLLWIVFFSNLLILYFLINWLPAVLQQAGMPIERAIIATVVLNVGGIVGGLSLGRLVDRRRPFGVLTIAYALAAILVAAIGAVAAGAVPVLMLTIFAAGFFVIGSQYCMNALAANYYPTPVRSTGIGWALGIGRIGSIVGPVVGGVMLSLGWDLSELFAAAAAPAAVAALAVFLIGWRLGQEDRASPKTTVTSQLFHPAP
jgi:AAHS family 4-hydroxybenzoate transporter-like MFS transporter